jgi:hypothetical protein
VNQEFQMNVYIVPEGKHYHTWDDVLKDAQQMKFTAFNTGSIYGALEHYVQPESLPHDCDPTAVDSGYAVMVFHFRHPDKGDILIDTGFDRSFCEDPPFGNLPISIRAFQKLKSIKYTQQENEDLSFHSTVPTLVDRYHVTA